jgi:hypothetical protein
MSRHLKKEIWPYRVKLEIESFGDTKLVEAEKWLETTLGPLGKTKQWAIVLQSSIAHIYFKDCKHATFFSLMWL